MKPSLNLLTSCLAAGCLGWVGCATPPQPPTTPVPAAAERPSAMAEHRVQPLDALQITVFREPDLSLKVRVNEAGTINYPLLGTVTVTGLTTSALETKLAGLLARGFVANPHVTVFVEASPSRRVVVLGQVRMPGNYEIPADETLTLLQVIGRSGGFTNIAATDRVNIIRTENGRERKILVDVSAIMKKSGVSSQDVELKPGDVITVPELLF